MKRVLVALSFLTLMYSACTPPEGKDNEIREAKGDREYGGAFKINERDEFQTLFPYGVIDLSSTRIISQIYEGLVKLDPKDLSIKPGIAESWEIDETGTVYTFHLKKGVYFHDDDCFPGGKGREVTADDFKYSFTLHCTQYINDSIDNLTFARTFKGKVLGSDRYFDATKKGNPDFELEGVKVIDDHTLQIILEQPSSSFIYILAHPIMSVISEEALSKYGDMLALGTGPFIFADLIDETDEVTGQQIEVLILTRNNNYHGYDTLGNQLPYLDSLVISFYDSQKRELALFQQNKLDMILGLPAESVRDIVEQHIAYFEQKPPKFILERSADMVTDYYEFNLSEFSVFQNKKVRHAFCYAINRNKIIQGILSNEAYGPGIHGITPPSFKDYDITQIKGYDFDPEKAKKLLAEAGYPDGKGFPEGIKLELNSGGFRNTSVAFEIQKQLHNVLNINIELEIVSMAQRLEDQRYAKADMFRSGWLADYPSPESFLLLMYGKNVPASMDEPSFINTPRYVNPEYDKLYEAGLVADSVKESYKYFLEAEQLMIDDAPIMILWYAENYRLLQSNVRNFQINAMHHRDFSEVYFQEHKVGSEASQKISEENEAETGEEVN